MYAFPGKERFMEDRTDFEKLLKEACAQMVQQEPSLLERPKPLEHNYSVRNLFPSAARKLRPRRENGLNPLEFSLD